MPFESPDWRLDDLLRHVGAGLIQLPDFQRDFKWDDPRIASLLASVSRGYPIGVVMTVETGGEGSRFKWRPLQGANNGASQQKPELLLLDGQQRLTSLLQALMSGKPVRTADSRGMSIERWYYINIDAALADNGDLEEAIVAVPADRIVKEDFGRKVVADYSDTIGECKAGMFPLRIVFDANAREDWSDIYKGLSNGHRIKWQDFRNQVLDSIHSYMVPLIKLTKDTPKEAVCTVFEKVNTGGIQLNVVELLTATFAGDRDYYKAHGRDFELREDLAKVVGRFQGQAVLDAVTYADFLQAVCLLSTRQRRMDFIPTPGSSSQAPAISCKRADMLRMNLAQYLQWRDQLVDAFRWCGRFLTQQYVFTKLDLPYPSQLIPLAVFRVLLGRKADNRGVFQKLRQWYWCGVLGEMYGGTIESRTARDVEQVIAWIEGGPVPDTVTGATFHENRLMSLSTRTSAAYKGVYALIMAKGCQDWLRNQRLDFATFADLKADIHHIFPKEWCRQNGLKGRVVESIVNKTAIAYDTNRAIGDRSPADYIPYLEQRGEISPIAMDVLIASHAISPRFLRRADFRGFFADRTDQLLGLIGDAMGKAPIRKQEVPNVDDPGSFVEDPWSIKG